MSAPVRRPRWHRRHPWGAGCLIAGALLAAPIAVAQETTGEPVNIGKRNPDGGQTVAAQRETQIIAETPKDTYGTRQSNKGAGGGAIYGCRSTLDRTAVADPKKSTACVRINNLAGGKAFDFVFDTGLIGGIIQSGKNLLAPNAKASPFVTNAVAVALGLNADRVDNLHATELIAAARAKQGLDADTVDGKDASELMAAGGAPAGCPDGTIAASGTCIETGPRAAQAYAAASTTCGQAGRRLPDATVLMYARTLGGINLGDDEMAADVTPGSVTPDQYATVTDGGEIGGQPVTDAEAFRCVTG